MSIPPIYIPPIYDMLGQLVEEGDRIAVAVTNGGSASAAMKIGRVIKITPARLTLLYEGKPSYSWQSDKTAIDHKLKKFIVINELTH